MLYSSTIQMSNWTNEFPEYFATNVQHLPHLSYRILQHPPLNGLNKMCNSIDPWQLNWKAMNAKYSNHGEPQNCLRFTSPARCKYNTKTLQKKYSERSFETKMINWSIEKLDCLFTGSRQLQLIWQSFLSPTALSNYFTLPPDLRVFESRDWGTWPGSIKLWLMKTK